MNLPYPSRLSCSPVPVLLLQNFLPWLRLLLPSWHFSNHPLQNKKTGKSKCQLLIQCYSMNSDGITSVRQIRALHTFYQSLINPIAKPINPTNYLSQSLSQQTPSISFVRSHNLNIEPSASLALITLWMEEGGDTPTSTTVFQCTPSWNDTIFGVANTGESEELKLKVVIWKSVHLKPTDSRALALVQSSYQTHGTKGYIYYWLDCMPKSRPYSLAVGTMRCDVLSQPGCPQHNMRMTRWCHWAQSPKICERRQQPQSVAAWDSKVLWS